MATIQQNIERIEQAKLDIKQAIVDKGVAVLDTDRIDTYASKIEEIKVGEEINNQDRNVIITTNGKPETITFDEGYTGLGSVTIKPDIKINSAPTYNCPWDPEEFLEKFNNNEWLYDWSGSKTKWGYIYNPSIGVGVTGTSSINGLDQWPRFHWIYDTCDSQLNKEGNEWKEPYLDQYTIEYMKKNNITPKIFYNGGWYPFSYVQDKPIQGGEYVKNYEYLDFFSDWNTASFISTNYDWVSNEFKNENDETVTLENPLTGNQYSLPLIPIKKGGYAEGSYWYDEDKYYGIIMYKNTNGDNDYEIRKVGDENIITFNNNIRYNNVSDFIIVQDDNGNYYDLATLTLELVQRPQPLTNLRYVHKLILWNDNVFGFNLENLENVDEVVLHSDFNFPSGIKYIGKITANGRTPIFNGCSKIEYIPWIDTSGKTDFMSTFSECSSLKEVPDWDFNSATNIRSMFKSCTSLTEIPVFDTSKITDMSYVIGNCPNVTKIPNWDFSKVIRLTYAFYNTGITEVNLDLPEVIDLTSTFNACSKLKSVNLNAPKLQGLQFTFNAASSLESIGVIDATNFTYIQSVFSPMNYQHLTNLGGFTNLKVDWNDNRGLNRCPNLTYESLMNVINGLYDFVGNGEVGGKTLLLSTASQSKLSDADIEIATNKGWTITFA